MRKNTDPAPDWERVLSAAARLQRILPEAVLDEVLARLESVAGWKTARVQRPAQILGSLDGIETGIRQLIRVDPLETTEITCLGGRITVPTDAEILRIKGALILRRNATRDYVDFVALADRMGDERVAQALRPFDRLYRQHSGESPLQQLQIQLANAMPYDLEGSELSEYRNLDRRWHDWTTVKDACAHIATAVFDRVCDGDSGGPVRGRES